MTFNCHDYRTVQIGDQCWFAENLRSTRYANGAPIPEVQGGTAWGNATAGARVAASNNADLATYGYLYNWYAVNSASGLCPSGWHVPTDSEWTTLTDSLGGESVAGVKMKSSLTDAPAWDGDNSSGFSALPGGYRNDYSVFYDVGDYGYWWSASPSGNDGWYRQINSGLDSIDRYLSSGGYQRDGFSVRCLRDT